MKQITTYLTAGMMLFILSCNNAPKESAETTAVDTTAKVEEKPVFQPYKAMMVSHAVKNYDKFWAAFQSHDSVRQSYGLKHTEVAKGLDNENMVYVLAEAADIQKAKDFSASDDLKKKMKEAGVVGVPNIAFLDVIRDDTTSIPQKDRLAVAHHVKDFDAWLKVYDAEGMAARANNGLVDRFMARGVDDTNMVYLFFAITDMEKAKARVNSPELKKIMTDAGVDGPPQISWFKWQTM